MQVNEYESELKIELWKNYYDELRDFLIIKHSVQISERQIEASAKCFLLIYLTAPCQSRVQKVFESTFVDCNKTQICAIIKLGHYAPYNNFIYTPNEYQVWPCNQDQWQRLRQGTYAEWKFNELRDLKALSNMIILIANVTAADNRLEKYGLVHPRVGANAVRRRTGNWLQSYMPGVLTLIGWPP